MCLRKRQCGSHQLPLQTRFPCFKESYVLPRHVCMSSASAVTCSTAFRLRRRNHASVSYCMEAGCCLCRPVFHAAKGCLTSLDMCVSRERVFWRVLRLAVSFVPSVLTRVTVWKPTAAFADLASTNHMVSLGTSTHVRVESERFDSQSWLCRLKDLACNCWKLDFALRGASLA